MALHCHIVKMISARPAGFLSLSRYAPLRGKPSNSIHNLYTYDKTHSGFHAQWVYFQLFLRLLFNTLSFCVSRNQLTKRSAIFVSLTIFPTRKI